MNTSCPIPIANYPTVQLAHGGGGTLMHQLLHGMILPTLGTGASEAPHDSAVLEIGGKRIAFTTDSYTVDPLFFPGGDIGSLAVNGTVNDLAMSGAKPLYLSAGMIIEEGFPMEDLWKIVQSMKEAAHFAGVTFVTGDTKVVDRGKGDGLFINTAGIGVLEHGLSILPDSVQAGDAVIVSGDIGRHGIAIMALREGIQLETQIRSDCAPVWKPVEMMLNAGVRIHCLRDLTRGGLASALVEIAQSAGVRIEIDERSLPVTQAVASACEILGFDPIHVANEGRYVAFVHPDDELLAIDAMREAHGNGTPMVLGKVAARGEAVVTMTSSIGVNRIVDMLSGEQLPRIC